MSRRQSERGSRFSVVIEQEVRTTAAALRDNNVEASVAVVVRLWWTSRLRGRRFAQVLHQARDVTQARISLGVVERGGPGRRHAMPYFLAVLRDLISKDRHAPTHRSASATEHGGMGRSAPFPRTPYPSALRAPDSLILTTKSGKSD